jgi:SpoVK/Ycf46/Vps4 family AAA+-type ATPase
MAARVLAADLGLDLFRIDLSRVVSKHIGETEKNLDALFEAARGADAILFFDEADALFGKRSEVKDAHDRYAHIEVDYLLQRLESCESVTILATDARENIDPAFLRRIRCAVDFGG